MRRRIDFGAAHDLQARSVLGWPSIARLVGIGFKDAALRPRVERESVHRAQGECHTPPV